jgi:hypothetical protein
MAPARKIKNARRGARRVVRRLKPRKTASERPARDPPARPVEYSFRLSETICERISAGQTTSEVCRDPAMPQWHVLSRWRREHEDFNRRYTIARQSCCELWADEIIEIADDATNDYVTRVAANGRVMRVFDRESFERSRLRVDSRKWTASKVLRHVYGDKSEVDLRTPDGVNVKVEERNQLIEAIVRLVHPKTDPEQKPGGRSEEARER